jgi:hypothetical protein
VSLADMHAIAHDLRSVVEQKLLALWEPWDDGPEAVVAIAGAADRSVHGERAVPVPRSVDRAPLAIETDRNAGAKTEAGGNRSPRTTSGSFRPRSAPLT